MASLEQEALEHTRQLLRIDSVNTGEPATIGDGETRAARYVQGELEAVGIDCEFVEPTPGRGSVVARLGGSEAGRAGLLLHAHLDVVPVVATDWTHDPFSADIADGFLYGRGVADMKAFAGTLLAVARRFAVDGIRPRRDLVFAFLADEEAGGVWGARWLVENRPELFDGVSEALSEVGGFSIPLPHDRRGYLLATAEKGVAWATLTARGNAAHGSRPTRDNAVVRLARAVAAIGGHEFPQLETEPFAIFAQVYAANAGIDPADTERLLAALPASASFLQASARNTVSPTVLRAGQKTNIIPAEATARLDIRILPDRTRRCVASWSCSSATTSRSGGAPGSRRPSPRRRRRC